MQAKQEPLEIGFLKNDLQAPLPGSLECVAPCLSILPDAVRVQQHQLSLDFAAASVALQSPAGCLDNIDRITPISRSHVQMKVKPALVTAVSEKLDEGPVALPFDSDEDDSPGVDLGTAAHDPLADPRKTA